MKKNSSFKLRSGNKPSMARLSGVEKSPMNKEMEKIPSLELKPIDMKPFEQAVEGRRMINMEKQNRKFMTSFAHKDPQGFYETMGISPDEYFKSLPYD
jgi:hypothetical protein